MFIIWLQIAKAREIYIERTYFPSQFLQDKKNSEKKSSLERIVKEEILVLFNLISCFSCLLLILTKFLSAKVTKFARFCKQTQWREKSVMPVGIYREITDR